MAKLSFVFVLDFGAWDLFRVSDLDFRISGLSGLGGRNMTTEKYTVSGDELLAKIKKLIHEGNIRRVRVIQGGKTVFEIPLSIGAPAAALGILIAPVLAAIGAFAALVTECTIEVEKVDTTDKV
jgi:hypothetical protein